MLTFGGPPPSPLLVNVFYGCSLWPIAACHCSVVPFPLPPPVENNFRSKVISTYCVINLTDNFGEDKTQVVLHREVNDSQKMNFALLHSFWKIAEWIYWYHLTSSKHLIGFFVVLITVRFFYEWSQKKKKILKSVFRKSNVRKVGIQEIMRVFVPWNIHTNK